MTVAEEAFVAQGAADHPIDLQWFGPAEIGFAFRGDRGRTQAR
jgi:hypothetical protein